VKGDISESEKARRRSSHVRTEAVMQKRNVMQKWNAQVTLSVLTFVPPLSLDPHLWSELSFLFDEPMGLLDLLEDYPR